MNTKTDISAAYVGSTGVDKLCLGNEVVWQNTPPGPAYDKQYFTVEANEAGTFYVRSENFDFSKNEGPWTSGIGNTAMTLAQGDKVRFRAANNYSMSGLFSGNTMSFQVYGNIESMEYGDNFSGQTSNSIAFASLFDNCTGLIDASNLVLPATSLVTNSYWRMFRGCRSLTTAPELPATTLADSCYTQMFSGCTSLTTAPELPATTLAGSCYQTMFKGCTSLTTAPELPATILVQGCYTTMFSGCTSLNYIKCLGTSLGSSTSTRSNWVSGVSATGTFVKAAGVTWPTGTSGIPSGWTVLDYTP